MCTEIEPTDDINVTVQSAASDVYYNAVISMLSQHDVIPQITPNGYTPTSIVNVPGINPRTFTPTSNGV